MQCKNEGTISFLAGLLMGGLIGAGIGMLVAPESGEVTRKKIQKASGEVLKKSKVAINKFQTEKVEPFVKEVEGNLKEKFDNLKNK